MKPLADFFLRAKPWVLFVLLFVFPNAFEVIAIAYIPSTFSSLKDIGLAGFIYLGFAFVYVLCLSTWLWSAGSFLNLLQKPAIRLNLSFFRFAVIFLPFYMLAFFLVMFAFKPVFDFIFPIHLFATLCGLYIICFVAKSIATVNKGKQVSLRDYVKPLVLLALFPIGIWSVQARINELYRQHNKLHPTA